MPYVVIEDFRAGLDTRKSSAASPTGSLQKLTNGHITRGGEIEKRKSWVQKYALPGGLTFGFAGANGTLYTFGSAPMPGGISGVTYQQLVHPSGWAMTGVQDTTFFDGKLFVAALYANGDVLEFYDGAVVADWQTGSGAPVAGQKATSLITVKDKVYATYSSVLAFSAVATPTAWQSGSGYGFINMSNQAAGSETLVGIGRYQGYIAVVARHSIQIWYVDPDPLQNAQRQVISNMGTMAFRSIVSYGDTDTFLLSDSGVRSLRARDASNQANVNDVGTAVDDEIVALMASLPPATVAAAAGAVEPISGRYILSIGTIAYTFSYFPTSRISAWSKYDLGFAVQNYVAMDGQLWCRSGDSILLYGDTSGQVYDTSEVEVELPYIDARTIATWKQFTGIDLVCEGTWEIFANTDVLRPTAEALIGRVDGTTISGKAIAFNGLNPVVKLRLVNKDDGAAKLSKVIVHYELTGEDG